ncbi:MAG: MarC family protein [Kiritimatiellia bacterium]
MSVRGILVDAAYLLALINPISKVSILSTIASPEQRKQLGEVALKSTGVAAGILFCIIAVGDFVLRGVFRVQVFSLEIAGGAVLLWAGFNALRRGVFFEQHANTKFADIAVVPLACPMIAGPATITAALTLGIQRGILPASAAVLIALSINTGIMLLSHVIANALSRQNLLGAVIRITGLVVMTIGVQMTLDGLSSWLQQTSSRAASPPPSSLETLSQRNPAELR